MDRMGRTGGGGPRYIMPVFEDGSTIGPGHPFYEQVRKSFTVDEWNALSDDEHWAMLDAFYVRPQDGMATNVSRLASNPMTDVLAGADNVASPLHGLFGNGPAPGQPIRAMPNMPNTLTPGEGPTPMMIKDWLRRG